MTIDGATKVTKAQLAGSSIMKRNGCTLDNANENYN